MNNKQKLEWTETKDQMPDVGQKIIVFLWMDETVSQAWWNGEHYVLAAADEQGIVTIYKVLPIAISHWSSMPELPITSNSVDDSAWQQQPAQTVH
ncbi:hypothetical protein A9Q78_04120 [Methylophaga sp. 41_12_T18]|nr:hypothetical protein A9Q78_04120 [Methylophaga sp. 41_12_T18]